MGFNLFNYLNSRIDVNYRKCKEYDFYVAHVDVLKASLPLRHFDNVFDEFTLFKASIILKALMNKIHIEDEIELLTDFEISQNAQKDFVLDGLPYFNLDGEKLYVPFFSRAINKHYSNSLESLARYPYSQLRIDYLTSLVNPFDNYGYHLYDSLFTSLIKICEHSSCAIFYHVDFEALFVINSQGSLDTKIALFDKEIMFKNKINLFSRLKELVEAYFQIDPLVFIEKIYELEFISLSLYQTIKNEETKKIIARLLRSKK